MDHRRSHKNGTFTSSVGFVIACVGSAVGLGNIWMFPYRLGQYGGAAFLLPYLLFVFLFGWVGLSAEFALGRRAGTGTLGAYAFCFGSRGRERIGRVLGWIPLLGSLGIAIGYSVIMGWVVRCVGASATGVLLEADPETFFSGISGSFGNLGWHAAVVVVVCLVLIFGVTAGIEKVSRVLMPLFYLLFLLLAVWVAFLPGAGEGYRFLFVPDWSALGRVDTWVMAMGQAFFSLSITGSGMIVYGAYLDRQADIPRASLQTALFDTMAALLAALAIMPAVFAFGVDPTRGPALIFVTLPSVFQQMPLGRLCALFFFVSVIFAGITSLINMFEAVIESWQHRFALDRRAAVALCGALTLGVGVFLEAEPDVGRWMDFVTIVIVPIGAVLGAASVYYVLGWKEIRSELERGHGPLSPLYRIAARGVYVPLTVLVLILGFVYQGIG